MKLLTSVPQKRVAKQAGRFIKLYGEMMNPILRRKTQHNIHKLAKTTDLFIDFDCCAYSFLKSVHTKKIAFFHFSFAQSMAQNPKRMKRIRKQLENYNCVVTISKAMKEEGCRLFPELRDKLFVIYNAKDQDVIRRNAEEKVADERINKPYFLAIERLEESQKDITTLLKAYAILRKEKGVDEKLYIIGKGKSEEQLQQTAVDLGINNDVEFLGFKSNPYPWIKNCKLLLHSAKFEGLPTVLVEGLLLGKLMVSTDCPTGPKEILNSGKAGMLVPVGDERAFADTAYRLLTDSALQQQILQGVEARAFDFTFPAIDQKISELL
jgi:glycosyltransferase involved in cell wall biosynthesis